MVLLSGGDGFCLGCSSTFSPGLTEGSNRRVSQENERQRPREFVEAVEPQVVPAPDIIPAGCGGVEPELVTVKEEEKELEMAERMLHDVDFVSDYDVQSDFNIGSSPSSSDRLTSPKPMEGLHDSALPPFLRKTFEMVDNPQTDPIVSWSETRNSFVVWDSHTFSKDLLPKYFKHDNFSSFIRQLNTYGFRKIDSDRWEFKNEGFQGGKKHLLKIIKRRSRYNKQQQHQGAVACSDITIRGLESQLEVLQKDQSKLQMEILRLKQQHERSQGRLGAMEERIQRTERRQRQMLSFFTRLAKNPTFVQQLFQRIKQQPKELVGGQLSKRRKLLQAQVNKIWPQAKDPNQIADCRNQVEEQLASMEQVPEVSDYMPEEVDTDSMENTFPILIDSIQEQDYDVTCGTNGTPDISVYSVMSQDLLCESADYEELVVNDTRIYLELEDLIGKPCGWGEQASELVEQIDCIGSMP